MRHPIAIVLILSLGYSSFAEDKPATEGEKLVRRDLYGDPLPDGAVARLGTLRWRAAKGVEALAFAPDGNTIACASYEIRLVSSLPSDPRASPCPGGGGSAASMLRAAGVG